MKRGMIVLTPFPFTDLKSKKVRPALIVSSDELESNDVILAFISSVKRKEIGITDLVLKEHDMGFKETGLKVDSTLKLGKLATIHKNIVLGEIGYLSSNFMEIANEKLKIALSIKWYKFKKRKIMW